MVTVLSLIHISSVKLTKKQIRSLAIEAARANQSVTLGKAVDSMSGGIDSVTHKAVTMTKMVSGAAVGSGVVLAGCLLYTSRCV